MCDNGGSNGSGRLLLKEQLQRVADRTDLSIRVAHYPSGCSKYNPIEHRLLLTGHNSDDILFLTHLGEPFRPDQLTLLVGRYVESSGVGKRGSCHLFRHTMATLMHDNGADIRFIQAMLGHAKLTTTEIYTQVSIKKLKEIHTATHPARAEREGEKKKRPRKKSS